MIIEADLQQAKAALAADVIMAIEDFPEVRAAVEEHLGIAPIVYATAMEPGVRRIDGEGEVEVLPTLYVSDLGTWPGWTEPQAPSLWHRFTGWLAALAGRAFGDR